MKIGDNEKMLAEKKDGVGWVTFNNPERRNAVSPDMWTAFSAIMDAYIADNDVHVVVLRGAGDKAFVSGADISQFESLRNNAEAEKSYSQFAKAGRAKMDALTKPLIAMIRGFCVGGGMATALKADIRIAAEDARFGIPAARLGLSYGLESLQPLVDLVGPAVAKDLLFTGRHLNAQEALRVGLLNQVVPVEELENTVTSYAAGIVANAPLTVRAAKLTINTIMQDAADRDLEKAAAAHDACMDSEDYAEGRRAFMEKRKPKFIGR